MVWIGGTVPKHCVISGLWIIKTYLELYYMIHACIHMVAMVKSLMTLTHTHTYIYIYYIHMYANIYNHIGDTPINIELWTHYIKGVLNNGGMHVAIYHFLNHGSNMYLHIHTYMKTQYNSIYIYIYIHKHIITYLQGYLQVCVCVYIYIYISAAFHHSLCVFSWVFWSKAMKCISKGFIVKTGMQEP